MMRRVLAVLSLALGLGSVAGCGHEHYVPSGELEVENSLLSFEVITAVEIDEVAGPNFLAYDVWVHSGDSVVMNVFPTTYDVTVLWEDGGVHVFPDVDVYGGNRTTITALR